MKQHGFGRNSIRRVIAHCVAFCLATALLLPQASSLRRFMIPGHGDLLLQVPQAWMDDIRRPPDNLPPTITFGPSGGSPFKVMITAGGSARPGEPVMDADTIRMHVAVLAKDAESQSVEKSLQLRELSGSACRGFYFSATDRAPKAGEFAHLTQGIARSGDILLAFTILTNDSQETVVKAALEMLSLAVIHSDKGR